MLRGRKPLFRCDMQPRRCYNEAGIHVPHTGSPDNPRPPLSLNAPDNRQRWCERPRNRHELLPEPREDQLDIESKDERYRNHLLEIEDVENDALKLPLLLLVQPKSVDAAHDTVSGHKYGKIYVDQLDHTPLHL